MAERVTRDAIALCDALGYDLNTVEFAVRDGVPYAIDFMNAAPDADVALGRRGELPVDRRRHGRSPDGAGAEAEAVRADGLVAEGGRPRDGLTARFSAAEKPPCCSVHSRADAVHALLDVVEILGRADEDEVAFAAQTKPVDFRMARSALSMSTPLSVAEHFAFDALARQDIEIALLAQQVEHLADVFVVDVDPKLAVALAIDGRLAPWRARLVGGRRRQEAPLLSIP